MQVLGAYLQIWIIMCTLAWHTCSVQPLGRNLHFIVIPFITRRHGTRGGKMDTHARAHSDFLQTLQRFSSQNLRKHRALQGRGRAFTLESVVPVPVPPLTRCTTSGHYSVFKIISFLICKVGEMCKVLNSQQFWG